MTYWDAIQVVWLAIRPLVYLTIFILIVGFLGEVVTKMIGKLK